MFGRLESVLKSEVSTLGYPRAALLAFGVAVMAYNTLAVMLAATRNLNKVPYLPCRRATRSQYLERGGPKSGKVDFLGVCSKRGLFHQTRASLSRTSGDAHPNA
jgi:hypothetical protein